jgi:hypothetical protein
VEIFYQVLMIACAFTGCILTAFMGIRALAAICFEKPTLFSFLNQSIRIGTCRARRILNPFFSRRSKLLPPLPKKKISWHVLIVNQSTSS